MNYRIAIVEDQPEDANAIEMHLKQFERENPAYSFSVEHFESGDKFLLRYRPIYDLVILDISLPGIDGMTAVERLRSMDTSVMLIFITSLANYAVKSYEVDAFDYILKPVSYPGFALKMRRAMNRLQSNRGEELTIRLRDGFRRLPTSHIIYVVYTANHEKPQKSRRKARNCDKIDAR